jgi:hypothetical protein
MSVYDSITQLISQPEVYIYYDIESSSLVYSCTKPPSLPAKELLTKICDCLNKKLDLSSISEYLKELKEKYNYSVFMKDKELLP